MYKGEKENGSTEHSIGNKIVPKISGYNTYRGWTQIEYQSKHCKPKGATENRSTQERMEGQNSS